MTEEQGEEMLGLLRVIAGQIIDMRQELLDFTSHGVQNMRTTVEDITGPSGYHLGDLAAKLDEIDGTLKLIDGNTTP